MDHLLAKLYSILQGHDLIVDSRQLREPARSCFFALPGERTHGRHFVRQLVAAGVRFVLLPGHYPEATDWLQDWPFSPGEWVLLSTEELAADLFVLPQVLPLSPELPPLNESQQAAHKASPLQGNHRQLREKTKYQQKVAPASPLHAHRLPLPEDALLEYFPSTSPSVKLNSLLTLLQALAAYHRRQLTVPVLAITGTHGKTIVKDWLTEIIRPHKLVYSSPRSYNSQIGLALSVWQIRPQHELAIIEAGISQSGEMDRLALVCQPNYGIFTTLGEAHRAGFKNAQEQLSEKWRLFANAKWVLTSSLEIARHPDIDNKKSSLKTWQHDTSVDYSFMADWQGNLLRSEGLELPLNQLPDLAPTYHYNACCALAAAHNLGLKYEQLLQAMPLLKPLANRLQVRAAANGSTLIDDSYNNDLTSLSAALDFADARSPKQAITLFLSDLLQSGQSIDELYKKVARLIRQRVKRLFLVGADIQLLSTFVPEISTFYFPSLNDLLKALPNWSFQDEVILIKGARTFGLEQLSDYLLQRRHRTQLEINLEALRHNLLQYRQQLQPGVALAVMVKASAYGSGDLAVARLLAREKVDYLIVAYTDEGIALRKGGISGRIMVLNPDPEQFELLQTYQLEPVLHNLSLLQAALAQSPQLPLHLEFDTGMSRLGFQPIEVIQVIQSLKAAGQSSVSSLFSHLAASEDQGQDDFTQAQALAFIAICEQFTAAGITIDRRHLLNSNGISRFPHYQFEMVRLGIGFYGISDHNLTNSLRPALCLKTHIAAIRPLPAGQTVSYGRHGKRSRDGRIGVLSIGYADGLPRLAGKGRFSVKIGNQHAPIIGAICMDMCMIDLSDLPRAEVGCEVIIFGPNHPIVLLAEAAQTIPYEILTGVGSRVHRIYVGE
ncbi:MAG: alanine racemase [Bacteroidota bacterium]